MDFLKWKLCEVDGTQKLFNEKGEEICCISHPNTQVFFTVWGVFGYTVNADSQCPNNLTTCRLNVDLLLKEISTAVRFEINGLIGMNTSAGDLLMPAIFDQIEVCRDYVYAHFGNRHLLVNKEGMDVCSDSENGEFYQNGKKGIKNQDGTVLFPAIYDKIYRWSKNSDVFYTCIGDEFHYYNSKHDEILTTYKKFDDIDDNNVHII